MTGAGASLGATELARGIATGILAGLGIPVSPSRGSSHIITEVGQYQPKPKALPTLGTGQVGYLLAGIKTLADLRIGA